jgi:hypothetical protein
MTPSNLSFSAATIARRSNLLAAAIDGSRLHCSMRKSRQLRCTAAKSFVLVVMTPKPLEESRNFGRATLARYRRSRADGPYARCGWHEVKQGVPEA